MSRFKKLFRKKRDQPPPVPPLPRHNAPEEFVYRRPEFRHSLYGDASYGAAPAFGTRPLRGNAASVSRPTSMYAQSAYEHGYDGYDSPTDMPHRAGEFDYEDDVDDMVKRMSRTSLQDQRAAMDYPNEQMYSPTSRDNANGLNGQLLGTHIDDSRLSGDFEDHVGYGGNSYDPLEDTQPHALTTPQFPSPPTDRGEMKIRRRPVSISQNSPQSVPGRPQGPRELPATTRTEEQDIPREHRPEASEIIEKAQYNSIDTDVRQTIAPAVTHETIVPEVHHIREERVTREIHNHDVYHRVLPIVDVEVLPPRHFVQQAGRLVEIPASKIPGRAKHWVVAETLSKGSDTAASTGPMTFAARDFPSTEGNAKKYITPEGIERTEQTWVHPPQLETGAHETGQTVPIYLD